jgi:hypothetical protein
VNLVAWLTTIMKMQGVNQEEKSCIAGFLDNLGFNAYLDLSKTPFSHIHEPLPELPALPPATVPVALPSILPSPAFPSPVVPWVSAPEALDDVAPVLALCPSVVPMDLTQFLNPDHSIRSWLTIALPLALAPWVTRL